MSSLADLKKRNMARRKISKSSNRLSDGKNEEQELQQQRRGKVSTTRKLDMNKKH